jgi:hypothetical protein
MEKVDSEWHSVSSHVFNYSRGKETSIETLQQFGDKGNCSFAFRKCSMLDLEEGCWPSVLPITLLHGHAVQGPEPNLE